MTAKLRRMGLAALAAAFVCASPASGQGYPVKPIRIIVPYAPGGTGEILGRALAAQMAHLLGEPVVVELKPGAGGNIGAEFVAKQSRPDGYTILFAASSLATSVSLMKLSFDPRKDLTPVAGVAAIPSLLSVGAASRITSLRGLVELARKSPGELTFGSSGPGTGSHLAGELFKAAAGIDLTHVAYRGTGAVYPDLIAGRISMVFDVMGGSALSQVEGGRVRPIAVTSARRSTALPNVPTIAEEGYPDFQFVTWFGFFAPAGVPAEAVDKLEHATERALAAPEVKERMSQIEAEPVPVETEAFRRYFDDDVARWAELVRQRKIAPIQM